MKKEIVPEIIEFLVSGAGVIIFLIDACVTSFLPPQMNVVVSVVSALLFLHGCHDP